ncbi:NADH-ubiquinone oxidoreductase B18 subunit-domain-containing protein [Xylariaceae sp. FL1019]|nr:NADH-ubiquinone oxidoreductase B18 subunit-domain-containing protein [Xylariaceae sp. FL1019]
MANHNPSIDQPKGTTDNVVAQFACPSAKLRLQLALPLVNDAFPLHGLIKHKFPDCSCPRAYTNTVTMGLFTPPSEAPAKATREEMRDAKLPLAYRDSCANLLIPLNRCRKDTYYLPWKCEDERHSYEKCQYVEFKKRVAKMDELRASKDGARSN